MSVRILVIEEDKEVRETYKTLIRKRRGLQLVAETGDLKYALAVLKTRDIDAVLMELEFSRGSGILLLEKIRDLQIEKPFIAVVTHVASKVIYKAIRELGVDYIYTKSDTEMTLDVPISIIQISAPFRKSMECSRQLSKNLNEETKQKAYRKNVEEELAAIGFPDKVLGTRYCKCALMFLLEGEQKEISITKDVYPGVAKQFGVTDVSVEKNIRCTIGIVWAQQDEKKLRECYPFEWSKKMGRPTNADFIYNMVRKILRQY